LPAVQQAREAARRTQCRNNLKQLGLALHNYHDAHNGLPPSRIEDWDAYFAGSSTFPGWWSWQTRLLPYLDQSSLYAIVDYEADGFECNPAYNQLFEKSLPVLTCPSDPGTPAVFVDDSYCPFSVRYASTNYFAARGSNRVHNPSTCTLLPQFIKCNGVFPKVGVSVKIDEIKDGTSNTIAVGERPADAGIPPVRFHRRTRAAPNQCADDVVRPGHAHHRFHLRAPAGDRRRRSRRPLRRGPRRRRPLQEVGLHALSRAGRNTPARGLIPSSRAARQRDHRLAAQSRPAKCLWYSRVACSPLTRRKPRAGLFSPSLPMALEPVKKRVIAFVDGQNLFHAAREAFGYTYPNFDPKKLALSICEAWGWKLTQVRFYTGIPTASDDPFWNHFWTHKLAQMGRQAVHTYSRPLRYHPRTVRLADGSEHTYTVAPREGCRYPYRFGRRRTVSGECSGRCAGLQPGPGSFRGSSGGPDDRRSGAALDQNGLSFPRQPSIDQYPRNRQDGLDPDHCCPKQSAPEAKTPENRGLRRPESAEPRSRPPGFIVAAVQVLRSRGRTVPAAGSPVAFETGCPATP
ncbi:MAG: DUF1559 domain-containing protein, partial [Nitrospira sp.]|nr:DUF1559 domain-containing protein [Nitrospira sp.]